MKRARFLQTGDIHVGAGRAVWGEQVTLGRAAYIFDSLLKACIEHKCEYLLITGDIFDTKTVTNKERELVVEWLVALSKVVHTFVIPGNHDLTKDSESNTDFLAVLSESGEVKNLYVARSTTTSVWPTPCGINVVGAPVGVSENTNKVFAAAAILDPDKQYIFMGHGLIGGVTLNDAGKEDDAPETRLSLAQANQYPNIIWWAYGDIHKRQPLPLPKGCNGWYAGSPIQKDFGETPGRGCLVVAFDEDKGVWKYRGKRYVQLDDDIEHLIKVTSMEDLEGLPEKVMLNLGAGLTIPSNMMEKVVKKYKVVQDYSTPVDLVKVVATAQLGFDPLLSSIKDVEDDVLSGLSADAKLVAKPLVAKAVDTFRNRGYSA